ncbi:MAG: hypothetical protein H0X65_12150 [Gemmatimonadetes bacterium]|nr:hypothetical protein [Gemmatimonadota bacterium]
MTLNPFGRRSIVRAGPGDRVYHLWTESAAIEGTSLRGDPVERVVITYQAPPVTGSDVEAYVQRFGEDYREILSANAPPRWPAVRSFLVDDQGRLWVGLSAPAGQPAEWVVLTGDGEYVGSVLLPGDTEIHSVRGERIAAVATDEEDVPRIVLYRIALPSAGGP